MSSKAHDPDTASTTEAARTSAVPPAEAAPIKEEDGQAQVAATASGTPVLTLGEVTVEMIDMAEAATPPAPIVTPAVDLPHPPPRLSPPVPFVARWDLDKTYLRTDFDTVRDLVRTAIERPDQKRTVPGAAALLRELGRAGVEIHILSGSPEQLRSRIEQKLRLDGARWASLTLKPNLENILRLRFRALRGQLGYKLPALLLRRAELARQYDADGRLVREVLLGDDAEADAFVYSLFADVCEGRVDDRTLAEVMRRGRAYEDTILDALRFAGYVAKGAVVERILIHLDRQSSPSDFRVYGDRVVPFYNYLQAAFVLHEDGRIPPRAVLRVAQDLVFSHNFDGSALARSYLDLTRRGHVTGRGVPELAETFSEMARARRGAGLSEIRALVSDLERMLPTLSPPPTRPPPAIDYLKLVEAHNRRIKK